MRQKNDNRISEKEDKGVVYTFQCTQEMREQIRKKAEQKDLTESELLEKYIKAGLKSRQPRGLKAKARVQVEVQEAVNQAFMKSNIKGATRDKVIEILKETRPLWE